MSARAQHPAAVHWMDRFIPSELLGDSELRTRARIVLWMNLLACSAFVLDGLVRHLQGQLQVLHHLGFLVVFALSFSVLPLTRSLRYASLVSILLSVASIFVSAVERQTMFDLTWGALLVGAWVYVRGTRAGWLIAALMWVGTVGTLAAGEVGILPPLNARLAPVDAAVTITLQVFFMVVFTHLYAREARSLASRLERARESAEEANRAKSVFLATMSHEIRTPMNGVIASADLLRRRPLDEDDQALVTTIADSGLQLLTLLDDILDISKLEAGQVVIESIPFSVRRSLEAVVALQHAAADEKGLDLRVSVDADVAEAVVGDPTRLRQVLLNLVSNAIKFTDEGRVEISVTSTEAGLRFGVEDTGVGLTAEQIGRLFQPFAQAAASVHRTHGGTGLGLAISQHLVTAMGGRIEVRSVPGRGSEFSFELGLSEASAALPQVAAVDLRDARPTLAHPVLVVDDNAVNRTVAKRILDRLGYASITSNDGEDAIRVLESQPVALVLMDRQMPGMDGLETTRRIRCLPAPASATPVLGLTASCLVEEVAECEAAGMEEVIAKPVTVDGLERAIARWARRAG